MGRNRKNNASHKKKILLVAVIVLIAVVVVVCVMQWKKDAREKEKVQQGVAYLKELEKQDVSEINSEIKDIRSEMNLDAADSDEEEIWSSFENAVVVGDSRAVGFSYYELIPEEQVKAENGEMISDAEKYIDEIKELNPRHIFLCYGLNDMKSGLWSTPEEYSAAYEKEMELLTKAFPDSIIYVNSILPAIGSGLESDPVFENIDEYNEGLRALCAEKGYPFIDNTSISEEHEDLYQEDGLHIQKEFYKYWAANMLAEVEE